MTRRLEDGFLWWLSQGSRGEFGSHRPAIDRQLELLDGPTQPSVGRGSRVEQLGEAWSDEARVGAREEAGGAEAELGDPVAMAVGHALDEPVEAQPAQLLGIEPQQWGQMAAQVASGEAGRLQAEDDQRRQQRLGALIGEAQR